MRTPQRERILEDLRPRRWVCGNTWLAKFMPRYAAVIWTLRHRDGYGIQSKDCDMHPHEGGVAMYLLTSEPVTVQPKEQMTWL